MSRLAWNTAPSLRVALTLPPPPITADAAVTAWMQQAQQAMEHLAAGNVEMQRFLDDVLNTIKDLDRDALSSVATVTGTADVTYSANEVTLINDLTTAVNALIAAT